MSQSPLKHYKKALQHSAFLIETDSLVLCSLSKSMSADPTGAVFRNAVNYEVAEIKGV